MHIEVCGVLYMGVQATGQEEQASIIKISAQETRDKGMLREVHSAM
jgi:hypothetical protein